MQVTWHKLVGWWHNKAINGKSQDFLILWIMNIITRQTQPQNSAELWCDLIASTPLASAASSPILTYVLHSCPITGGLGGDSTNCPPKPPASEHIWNLVNFAWKFLHFCRIFCFIVFQREAAVLVATMSGCCRVEVMERDIINEIL